ncbi:MAG: transporter [Planctomycetota bacterium]|nr:MAG: transporter [Planctomycetota bacterium]
MDWLLEQRPALVALIFAATYLGIALGGLPGLVLDRTGVALLGAIAMLATGALTIEQAVQAVDHETVLLLFGLMIFSAQLRVAGFYVTAGRFLTRLTERPLVLLGGLVATSAALSALLANDIVCLALTPLLCSALLRAGHDPIPYLVALATSSNVGSAATIIGNPQNMFIGSVGRLDFGHYTLVALVPVLVSLVLCWGLVAVLFHRRLHAPPEPPGAPLLHPEDTLVPTSLPLQLEPPARDDYLIAKTLVLLAALVVCFLFVRGQWRAIAALAGAGLLLCSRRARAARLYQLVDFNLILLFLGLFAVHGALEQQGLTARGLRALEHAGIDLRQPALLAAVTLGLSNLVSNVPAVLLLEPALSAFDQTRLWYLLALASTFAGNLTLVGSVANLIVAESASAFGVRLSLGLYCRVGVPLTLLTVALATLWIAAVL